MRAENERRALRGLPSAEELEQAKHWLLQSVENICRLQEYMLYRINYLSMKVEELEQCQANK